MHELRPVETPDDWRDLHAIRREVLFDTGVMPFVYDENHPDDRARGNTPCLLLFDGEAIGVVRLDRRDAACVVRLVGIRAARQRRGHGSALGDFVETEAAGEDIAELRVNASRDAVGFYEKIGWHRAIWDAGELARAVPGCVQMVKALGA